MNIRKETVDGIAYYPYHDTVPVVDDGLLYHYTSIESAKIILRDLTLKLSDARKFNDPSEGFVSDISMTSIGEMFALDSIIDKTGILCFTKNQEIRGTVDCGYNRPRMWAQYARNNTGVCIAINQKAFLKENEETLKKGLYMVDSVKYRKALKKIQKRHTLSDKELNCKIPRVFRDIFFEKYIDWRDEKEVRFLGVNLPDKLSIANSIQFVVLGSNISYYNLRDLVSIVNDPNSCSYGKLGEMSFVRACYSAGGVEASSLCQYIDSQDVQFVK